jgi:hypothetical protein
MRSFTSYLNRRNITDLAAWASRNNIQTQDDLEAFLASRSLRGDIEGLTAEIGLVSNSGNTELKEAGQQQPKSIDSESLNLRGDEVTPKTSPKPVGDGGKPEESWHVPAALRPYGKVAVQDPESKPTTHAYSKSAPRPSRKRKTSSKKTEK